MPHATSRPLSPHISIYKPQISSVLSISHRLTGVFLVLGAVVLVGWLWGAAFSEDCFNAIQGFFAGWIGKIFLLGWGFAFYYHLGNGIRHLFWDAGYGYSLPVMTKTGWLVVLFALGATATTGYYIYLGNAGL